MKSNVFLSCLVAGFMFLTLILSIKVLNFSNDKTDFENKRQICNQAVFSKKTLPESLKSHTYWSVDDVKTIDDAKNQISRLETQIAATNIEVNNLHQIIGCYFDK